MSLIIIHWIAVINSVANTTTPYILNSFLKALIRPPWIPDENRIQFKKYGKSLEIYGALQMDSGYAKEYSFLGIPE